MDYAVVVAIAAVIIAVLAVVGRSVLSRIVVKHATRKFGWAEREQFHRKQQLLEAGTLREFYAPRDEFQREWDAEKKKPALNVWTSPYPKAVKEAWKAARKDSPNRLTMVKQQVAAAAQSFTVETLPDELQPHNEGDDHFSITLDLNGKPYEQVAGLASTLKSQLRLSSLEVGDNGGDFGSVRLIGHAVAPIDRLEVVSPGRKFLDETPAESPFDLPLAVTDKGEPWCLQTHHTFIYGLTGAGKTAPLYSMIYQLAPFVRKGLVKIYVADLKNSMALPFKQSTLVERTATTMDSIERLVADVAVGLEKRIAEVDALSAEEQDRYSTLTPERPLVILMFDEMTGALIKSLRNRASRIIDNLTNVTLLGRELNYLLIGAGQIVRRDILENVRPNIVNGIALRAESTGWSSFVLFGNFEDKRAEQFDASQIELASNANGYKTAGIGYAKGEGGVPHRIRFANVTRDEMRELAATFPQRDADTSEPEAPERVEEVEHEEEMSFEQFESAPVVARPQPERQAPAVSATEKVRGLSTDELKRLRPKLAAHLELKEDPRGRHMLNEVDRELRTRATFDAMPVLAPDDDGFALPDLEF